MLMRLLLLICNWAILITCPVWLGTAMVFVILYDVIFGKDPQCRAWLTGKRFIFK